ncbi:hypothetical protein EC973_000983 [Apophysomyces ossiformis]|uniref:Uncharacterized protein n=1 Tax=Apophysomyces ossiformis TaxID=679940 RepID=A0A8H7EPM9_9FUNG|nr:hypothetical protein EC973_000983 [Apophysomyces ossiformis]
MSTEAPSDSIIDARDRHIANGQIAGNDYNDENTEYFIRTSYQDDDDYSQHLNHQSYRENDDEVQQRLFPTNEVNYDEKVNHNKRDVLVSILEEGDESLQKRIEFDDLYNSSFTPKHPTLVWVQNEKIGVDPRDGIFTYRDPETDNIILESIQDRKSQVYVNANDLIVDHGLLNVQSFEISADAKYLMFWTNKTSQYRHSYFSNVFIYDLANRSITPLTADTVLDEEPKIAYAVWSPTGHQVAYVKENNLYVTDLQSHKQVTFDGSATVFNGVPDWVYEEEVFGTNFAVWWSPDSTHLAYLRLDETAVPEFHMALYTTSNQSYPEELKIRYPKAGAPNPLVSLYIYSLPDDASLLVTTDEKMAIQSIKSKEYKDFELNDRIITEVTWATEAHSHLLFKQTNRVQDHQLTIVVTLADGLHKATATVAREYKPEDGGWVDVPATPTMVFLSSDKGDIRYLDVADNKDGFAHLVIFSTGNDKPVWLTSGEWEVVAGTVVVDKSRQLVHFISTELSPLERHLYTISLESEDPALSKTCRTCPDDPDVHAYYAVTFTPKAGFYVLNYLGPDIPTTVVKSVDDGSFEVLLENNTELKTLLKDYSLPRVRMTNVRSGNIDMNAMEILPPSFDASLKYPVLFHVYGGPSSQLVSYQYDLSWHTFVASQLGYIVVTVDGRGTGFRGRKYRVGVRRRLGELETIDQVNAGRYWASLDYVDESRIAIWGWSYGGYMTTKVLEANDGVFGAGLAVAPVTDWRFYDSIYTERYMLTPELNPQGYVDSAVNNMTGFENAKYLLVHGTGDDNVHFQHSAVLVDKLTQANVHNYRVQFFSDNNHAIRYHNANKNVYYLLTEFLFESFGGKDYAHVRAETHGHFSGPLKKVS